MKLMRVIGIRIDRGSHVMKLSQPNSFLVENQTSEMNSDINALSNINAKIVGTFKLVKIWGKVFWIKYKKDS